MNYKIFPLWLVGAWTIPGPVWAPKIVLSAPFKRFFLWRLRVSLHVVLISTQLMTWVGTLCGFLELSLWSSPFSRSLPYRIAILTTQLHLLNSRSLARLDSSCPHHDLQNLQVVSWGIVGFTSFVSHVSGITVLGYLISNVLTTAVSNILSGF